MARIRKGSRKTKATSRLFVIERKTFLGRKNGTRFQMEKSEIEEHRQILPGGLSVFILFAEKKITVFSIVITWRITLRRIFFGYVLPPRVRNTLF